MLVHGELDVIAGRFASFEIRMDESVAQGSVERALLRSMMQRLDSVGITCGQIKLGSFCVFTRCQVGGAVVNLGIMAATRLSEHSAHCAVHCINHIPWWRRLLRRTSPESFGCGESLSHVCAEVDRVLASSPNIDGVKWVTREELREIEKELG